MATVSTFEQAVDDIKAIKVSELGMQADAQIQCPTCDRPLGDEWGYAGLDKVQDWTVAQLVAFHHLAARSGITFQELLERTSGGASDHVGVHNFHGMYVGIEADGYTHS